MSFTRLTKMDVRFVWDENCKAVFVYLKQSLTTKPFLVVLNCNEPYIIYFDASCVCLGCMLMKNDRVVVYASRQLKPHKNNYPTHVLKLTAMTFTFKIWRSYLYGVKFEIYFDHNSLKYLFSHRPEFESEEVGRVSSGLQSLVASPSW